MNERKGQEREHTVYIIYRDKRLGSKRESCCRLAMHQDLKVPL